jgi:cytochrome o ubiquinol oxidase operon protein cyoD
MKNETGVVDTKEPFYSSFNSYVFGFVISIALTLATYFLVVERLLPGWILVHLIIGLAVIQAIAQLIFFLSLGKESKPRFKLLTFFFMVLVVFIVVLGTLWIMFDLDNRVMPSMPKMPVKGTEQKVASF